MKVNMFVLILCFNLLFCGRTFAHPDHEMNEAKPNLSAQAIVVTPEQGRIISTARDKARVLADGSQTEGQYSLFELYVESAGGPPPHIHGREVESFYVLEGQFLFQVGERKIDAGPGTFIHSPKGTLHTFTNTGTTRGRMLVWVIPSGLENFFKEVGTELPNLEAPAPPSII